MRLIPSFVKRTRISPLISNPLLPLLAARAAALVALVAPGRDVVAVPPRRARAGCMVLRSPAGRVAVLNVLDSRGAEQSRRGGGAGHQEDVSCSDETTSGYDFASVELEDVRHPFFGGGALGG